MRAALTSRITTRQPVGVGSTVSMAQSISGGSRASVPEAQSR